AHRQPALGRPAHQAGDHEAGVGAIVAGHDGDALHGLTPSAGGSGSSGAESTEPTAATTTAAKRAASAGSVSGPGTSPGTPAARCRKNSRFPLGPRRGDA